MSEQRMMFHRWRADAEFAALSIEARDLWYGLMGICDSWGCLKMAVVPIRNAAYLGHEVLPELEEVEAWLLELREAGFLRCWQEGEKIYAELKWFMEEQRIRYRAGRETPMPPWRGEGGEQQGLTGAEGPAHRCNHDKQGEAPPDSTSVAAAAEVCTTVQTLEKLGESCTRQTLGESCTPGCRRDVMRCNEMRCKENQEQEACQARPEAPSVPVFPVKAGEITASVYADSLPRDGPPDRYRGWEVLAALTVDWGCAKRRTLEAIDEMLSADPRRLIGLVLGVQHSRQEIHSRWGALRYAVQRGWFPDYQDSEEAKRLLWRPMAALLSVDSGPVRLGAILSEIRALR